MTGHGGTRRGAGRPYAYREPLRHVTVTLPDSYIEQLRRYGDDNLSEGIRLLVEEARTASGRSWYCPARLGQGSQGVQPLARGQTRTVVT